MSNEVDKRIIEMEFKNAEFEKNASKTLQTLQELKAKLNNNFSTKGPEELNRAIKAVDVSPITKGIEAVQIQFSALQIAGKRVIENITDAAMGAIVNIKNKLGGVINQIKVGGANRAQNIEQAKFMLSGLGIEWADIVDDINYGVQDTAYGLDAAARVASQLVASNVALGKDMQASLRGVSGVAAMTNSTYEEIGHIFTSVAGQGKLMTMQLQQFSLRGLNVAADLAKSMGTTEAAIREMVTKGQIDFMTFARAMDELYGGHAKEANNTFTGALSNTKAALSRLGADVAAKRFETIRQILVKIIPKLKELKTAMKPVEEGINTAMEAVGKLIEYLVDRVNVTGIVETIAPKIQRVTDKVTEFANTAREYIQNLDNSKPGKFIQNLTDTAEKVEEIVKFTEREIELAKQIWEVGDLGNGEDRVRNIEALGESYEHVQAAVDLFIDSGYTWDAVMQQAADSAEQAGEATGDFIGPIAKAQTKPTAIWLIIDSLYDVIRVIKNIAGSGTNLLKVIFNSLTGTFGDHSILEGINTITGKIADLSDKLYISAPRAQKLRPIFDALFTVFKVGAKILIGIAKALGTVITFLAKIINKARDSKLVNDILKAIGKSIKAVVNGIEKIYTKLKETGVWDKFIDILKTVATWIGEKLIDGFNKFSDFAGSAADKAIEMFGKLSDKVKDFSKNSEDGASWLDKIKEFFKEDILSGSWLTKLKETIESIFGTGVNIFQNAYTKTSEFMKGLVEGFKSIDRKDIDDIFSMLSHIIFTYMSIKWLWSTAKMNKGIGDMTSSIGKMFQSIGLTIKKYGKKADAERFKTFADAIVEIVGSIAVMMIVFAGLEHYGYNAERIMDIVSGLVLTVTLIVGLIVVLKALFSKATSYSNSRIINFKIPQMAITLIAIGQVIATLIKSVLTMYLLISSNNYDPIIMTKVTLNIGLLVTIFSLLAYYMTKLDSKMTGLSGLALTFVSLGIVVSMLMRSFKKVLDAVKDVKTSAVERAMKVMTWLTVPILAFGAIITAINKFGNNNNQLQTNPFKGITGLFISFAILMRAGFIPLLRELADMHKMGEVGQSAIKDFQSITKWLLIFISGITVVVGLLDKTVNFASSKNVTGVNLLQGRQSNSDRSFSSTSGGGGSFWAVAGIVAAIAGLFAAIGYTMKNMKGLDSESLKQFKEITIVLSVLMGVLAIIGAVVGQADQTRAGLGILLGIAAVIAAVAATFLAAGYGFKAFEEALTDLIDKLPNLINKLVEFFKMIASDSGGGHYRGSVRNEIVNGVGDLTTLFLESVSAAIVAWSTGLVNIVPELVTNLFTTLIVALNSVADEFNNQGPELVNAADRASKAFLGFCGLVMQKVQENGGKLFKNIGNAIVGMMIENLAPEAQFAFRKVFGLDDWDDIVLTPEYWAKQAELEEQAALLEKNAEARRKAFEAFDKLKNGGSAVATEFIDIDEDRIADTVKKYVDNIGGTFKNADFSSIKNVFENKLSSMFSSDELTDMVSNGLFVDINNMMGDGFNIESMESMWSDLDLTTEDGVNTLNQRMENFFKESDASWDLYSSGFDEYGEDMMDNVGEGINERMVFVTDITHDAMEAAVNEIGQFREEFYNGGVYCGQGFALGLADAKSSDLIIKSAADMVLAAKHGVEVTGKIQSPSKVFMQLGKFITMGFANGIVDSVSLATESANEVGEATILSMRETIRQASLEAVNGIDSPRITPVLDLSNVTEGMGIMNSMFDTSHAVGLGITTSTEARAATSRRIAAVYQNGSNYDDTNAIGAINSLQGEVSTLKDAINGMQVVIDGRALVGQIATPMDKALGKKALAGRRGV